jgi:hypothetical protein
MSFIYSRHVAYLLGHFTKTKIATDCRFWPTAIKYWYPIYAALPAQTSGKICEKKGGMWHKLVEKMRSLCCTFSNPFFSPRESFCPASCGSLYSSVLRLSTAYSLKRSGSYSKHRKWPSTSVADLTGGRREHGCLNTLYMSRVVRYVSGPI